MKSNRSKDYGKSECMPSEVSREARTPEARRREQQQGKEFIRAMNEFRLKRDSYQTILSLEGFNVLSV